MPQFFRRRYGFATTVNFVLFEIDGIDFRITAAHAAGDTKIMKDEGVETNTNSGFVDEGTGYSIALTAAEMAAARIVIYLVDQTGPKAWLDEALIIETEGNQSAQHKLLGYNGWITTVTVTNQQEMVFADGPDDNDALLDNVVIFEDSDGSLSRPLVFTSWVGATKTGTWATDPTFTVVTGDTAYMMPISPADSTATLVTAVWAALRSANSDTGSFGEGLLVEDLNTAAKASVNTEIDNALNTAIPGSPTADSINERMAAIDNKLPAGTISDFEETSNTVDVGEWLGSAVTAAIPGKPDINIVRINGTAESARNIARIFDIGATSQTAQAGSNSSITLGAGESSTTDIFKGCVIYVATGTAADQARLCIGYDGGTKIADVYPDWITNPVSGDGYALSWLGNADVQTWGGTGVTVSATTNLPEVDTKSISDNSGAADNLEASTTTIVLNTAKTGTLSVTQMSTNLTEATNNHYNGRTVIWVDGVLAGQASDITNYVGVNGVLTFSAVTDIPSDGDAFVIV